MVWLGAQTSNPQGIWAGPTPASVIGMSLAAWMLKVRCQAEVAVMGPMQGLARACHFRKRQSVFQVTERSSGPEPIPDPTPATWVGSGLGGRWMVWPGVQTSNPKGVWFGQPQRGQWHVQGQVERGFCEFAARNKDRRWKGTGGRRGRCRFPVGGCDQWCSEAGRLDGC